MKQSKAISAAMKALASKFITSYHQLVDNLDYITVGADIVQKLKKLGDIDNIRLVMVVNTGLHVRKMMVTAKEKQLLHENCMRQWI